MTNPLRSAQLALSIVWIGTGIVSLVERHGQSVELLSGTLIADPVWQQAVIVGGAAFDLAMGLVLALWPSRRVFELALAVMTLMTITATVLNPALWLHPLGPLLKNIPIAVLLWSLRESATS